MRYKSAILYTNHPAMKIIKTRLHNMMENEFQRTI